MSLSRAVNWSAVALALLALPACSGGSKKPKVAFITNNPEQFWTIAEAGAKEAAEAEGVELVFRRPAQGEVAKQKEIIGSVLNQDVKAIAVSVIDPETQTDYLNDIAPKVSLLTVDNDAPESKRLAYLGTNNYLAGRAVGKLVRRALSGGGVVVFFVGDMAALNARQRRQGVIDELGDKALPADIIKFDKTPDGVEVGKYRLYDRTWTDQPEGAQKAKENAVKAINLLKDEKNVCMVGLWAYNPPQILGAVKDAIDKKILAPGQVKIVGFDEDFATLDGILDGHIDATVVQQPFEFGKRSVTLMAALAKGDKSKVPAGGIDYIPYRIITKEAGLELKGEPKSESAKEFRTWLEKVLGPK